MSGYGVPIGGMDMKFLNPLCAIPADKSVLSAI